MKIITVSDETKHLIDAQVQPGYDLRQTATRLPDGHWTIPVDDEVFDRIEAARLPDRPEIVIRVVDRLPARRVVREDAASYHHRSRTRADPERVTQTGLATGCWARGKEGPISCQKSP